MVFDFNALRTGVNSVFTNMVRTDGHAVDSIFARLVIDENLVLPDLELVDFNEDELLRVFHLWGVDPGLTSVYCAVDGHGEDGFQIRSFSTDHFYHESGWKETNRLIIEAKDAIPDIRRLEGQIVSSKTSNLNQFQRFLISKLNGLGIIRRFYATDLFRERRFLNYVGRQRVLAELVNVFVDGGRKYPIRPPPFERR